MFSCDITFAEKARIFSHDLLKSCVYISSFETRHLSHIFTKKLYSKLISTTHLLEDFLDFHGAKNNEEWYFYRELAATVRHLCLAGYAQQHIFNRIIFYELSDIKNYRTEGDATLGFIRNALVQLAPIVLEEARRLSIPIPEGNFDHAKFPGVLTGEMLDYNIDDEDNAQQQENIVKISSEFLTIAKNFGQFNFYKPYTSEEIREIVPLKVNEVTIRRFEMLVHNLQSSFDSYVIHGGYLFGNRKLKQLRGYFSAIFHLLQIMGRLLHYYERHLHEMGYKEVYMKTRNRLAGIIGPDLLLDRTINYGLFYVCHFFSTGKKLAREILNENIQRDRITVGVPVTRGFHSRPSLMVAKIVQYFGGQVELCVGEDRFDASSVLDIQWAGGKIQKEAITEVTFEGDARALKDLAVLAGVNYGEDTMGKGIPLPQELKYLR